MKEAIALAMTYRLTVVCRDEDESVGEIVYDAVGHSVEEDGSLWIWEGLPDWAIGKLPPKAKSTIIAASQWLSCVAEPYPSSNPDWADKE